MNNNERTYDPAFAAFASYANTDVRRTVIPPDPNEESADMTSGSAD
jgi:hypothetical protein